MVKLIRLVVSDERVCSVDIPANSSVSDLKKAIKQGLQYASSADGLSQWRGSKLRFTRRENVNDFNQEKLNYDEAFANEVRSQWKRTERWALGYQSMCTSLETLLLATSM